MNDPSEPTRLARDANAGPLADWMRAGQQDLPSDEQLARLAARLEPTFATPVSGPAAPLASPLRKLLLGALGVAGIAALALTVRGTRETAPTAPKASAVSAAPAVAAPEPAASPASPVMDVAPPPPSTTPGSTAGNRGKASSPGLSEAALLELARSALTNDPARALALTRQHQARFPSGVLKQEREVIAIEALRRLGQSKAASDRASSFERAFPDSAHRRAVESGLSK